MKEQIGLVIAYAVVVAVAALGSIEWVRRMRDRRETSKPANLTTVLLFVLAAAILLLPALDVSLVASLNDRALGALKNGVTQRTLDTTTGAIAWGYASAAIATAALLLVAVPFSYAYFEDGDYELLNDDYDASRNTAGRALRASRYALGLTLTAAFVFFLGLVVPSAKQVDAPLDGDYVRDLLRHARPVKALLFLLGCVAIGGSVAYGIYGGLGYAALPVGLIKAASPGRRLALASGGRDLDDLRIDLEANRRKQRQISLRSNASQQEVRELDRLRAEERDLEGALRLANQPAGGERGVGKIVAGIAHAFVGLVCLLLVGLLVWSLLATWLGTLIDSRACGPSCGFLDRVPRSALATPLPALMGALPKPAGFAVHVLLALTTHAAFLSGLATYGVRFLWMQIFTLAPGNTPPQGLLLGGTLPLLAAYGAAWTAQNFILAGYLRYGGQTFCSAATAEACAQDGSLIKPCTELVHAAFTTSASGSSSFALAPGANALSTQVNGHDVCIESVISRITTTLAANYPTLAAALFWIQPLLVVTWLLGLLYTTCSRRFGAPTSARVDEEDDEEGGPSERSRLL